MEARVYDRIAAVLSVMFLLGLAAGSYYLAVWAGRGDDQGVRVTSNEPDVFVQDVLLTEVDADGEPVFRMSARDMRHYPIDGTSEFHDPVLVSLNPARPELRVVARRATILPGGNETVLTGDVELRRRADADRPELIVLADQMVVDADTETARTDGPVNIRQGDVRLTAVGMEFDNVSRALQLSSQVRAVVPVPKPVAESEAPVDARSRVPGPDSG
jgi:lipopolysaccharide export system protein LptC